MANSPANDGRMNGNGPVPVSWFRLIMVMLLFATVPCPASHSTQRPNPLLIAESGVKNLARAIQMYRLDNDAFPAVSEASPYGLHVLTTPVPYLSVLPCDPFLRDNPMTEEQARRMKRSYLQSRLIHLIFPCVTLYIGIRLLIRTMNHVKGKKTETSVYAVYLLSLFFLLIIQANIFMYSGFDIRSLYRFLTNSDHHAVFNFAGVSRNDNPDCGYRYYNIANESALVLSVGPDAKAEDDLQDPTGLTTGSVFDYVSSYSPLASNGDIWAHIPADGEIRFSF